MSQTNYETLLPEIEAIPDSDTKKPNMPVEKYVQEAANIGLWSIEDRSALEQVGVPPATFDTLITRTGALGYAQSLWSRERHTREEAQQEWLEQEPIAVDLKNELEHSFRFAFRNRQDLLNKVHEIEVGTGNADLLQDLSDLAVLGNANLDLLTLINFDTNRLLEATDVSTTMSALLAEVTGEKADDNSARVIRDKAFTYLKSSVDEIREAGKFVFWRDDRRRKGYGHVLK